MIIQNLVVKPFQRPEYMLFSDILLNREDCLVVQIVQTAPKKNLLPSASFLNLVYIYRLYRVCVMQLK
jgi:hypothetical protein